MIETFHLRVNKNHKKEMKILKKYGIVIILVVFTYLLVVKTTIDWRSNDDDDRAKKLLNVKPACTYSYAKNTTYESENYSEESENDERKSYENLKFIEYEKQRRGPGEHAVKVILTDPLKIKKNEEWQKNEGFSVLVSDTISLDRALPDYRPKACKSKKYLTKLPKVSIVIIFHNEILSVLLRLMHSVVNRSPPELLHEIVLVNDASTYENLGKELESHIANDFFEGKVKYHKNDKREGTIRTRMIGARLAEAEVIVFLDSHMEVATTWLPPLLEPIVKDPTIATVPIIESLNPTTFEYINIGNGFNGIFDWSLRYQYLLVDKKYRTDLGENYPLACMTAGAYAIRRDHFFELGGYDEGMKVYNGENWTMCFKLWMCKGSLIHVPCSRVIHLSKTFSAYRAVDTAGDYFAYNLKRVAEVWMDDYKKLFYKTDQARYDKIDAGDLSEEFSVKKRLNCKPFQYYLDEVAPQILEFYPIVPVYYATGSLQLLESKKCMKCNGYQSVPILVNCTEASNFTLNVEQSIRLNDNSDQCLDSGKLWFYNCHHLKSTQQFIYNLSTNQLKNPYSSKCLTGKDEKVFMEICNENVDAQKWKWTVENSTALENMNKMF